MEVALGHLILLPAPAMAVMPEQAALRASKATSRLKEYVSLLLYVVNQNVMEKDNAQVRTITLSVYAKVILLAVAVVLNAT